MINRRTVTALAVLSLVTGLAFSVVAQQKSGEPGSPSATVTLDGKQLPLPPPAFGGVIKENA